MRGSTCVARNAAPSFHEVALSPVPPPLLCLIANVAASGVSLLSSWKKVVNVAALALCPIPLRWESVGLEAGPGLFQTRQSVGLEAGPGVFQTRQSVGLEAGPGDFQMRLLTAASLREELALFLSIFDSSPACIHRHR